MENAPQLFTASFKWELLSKAATELHAIMRRSRRNRWWFRQGTGSQSIDQGTQGDHEELVFRQWKLFRGKGGGLYCEIRGDCYEPTRPPQISIEFRMAPQNVGVQPPSEMRDKRLVVRIGLTEEGKQGATLSNVAESYAAFGEVAKEYPVYDVITKGRTVPSSPEQARRHIRKAKSRTLPKKLEDHPRLKQYESAINPSVQQWWVDPKCTPVYLTKFVLLVYLVREDYLDPNTPQIKSFLRCRVFSRWMKDPNIRQLDELDILSEISMRFAMPQRWNDVVTYIEKTVKGIALTRVRSQQEISYGSGRSENSHGNDNPDDDVKAEDDEAEVADYDDIEVDEEPGISKKPSDRTPHDLKVTADMIASHSGISRTHVYRLARQGKIPSSRDGDRVVFTKESLEAAQQYADERRKEKDVIQLLVDHCGKTTNAAYRLLQRKKKKGLSLEDIAGEALRERDRQS